MARFRLHLGWILVGVLLLAAGAMYAYSLPSAADLDPDAAQGGTDGPLPSTLPGKRQTFLVMGVDERPGDAGRADSVMLVSWDPKTDQVGVVSLPRDLWVQIPGHGYDKLNHSFAYGGEKLMTTTVEKLLGLSIDHHIVVNFQGFRKVIDAVGGVNMDVEKRMYYEDPVDPDGPLVIDFYPGPQRLDGNKALHYARFRSDEEGDIGRMRRQQRLLKALVTEVLRPANFTQLPSLVRGVAGSVRTDLSVTEMAKLAVQGAGALKQPMTTGSVAGEGGSLGGIFYLVADIASARADAYRVLTGEEPDDNFLTRAQEAQAVYNAAWHTAAAASAARQAALEQEGQGGGEAGDGAPATGDGATDQQPPSDQPPADGPPPSDGAPPEDDQPPAEEPPPAEGDPGVPPEPEPPSPPSVEPPEGSKPPVGAPGGDSAHGAAMGRQRT